MKLTLLALLPLLTLSCVSTMRPADQSAISEARSEVEAAEEAGAPPAIVQEKRQAHVEAVAEGAANQYSDWYALLELGMGLAGGAAATAGIQKFRPSRAQAEVDKLKSVVEVISQSLGQPSQQNTTSS